MYGRSLEGMSYVFITKGISKRLPLSEIERLTRAEGAFQFARGTR